MSTSWADSTRKGSCLCDAVTFTLTGLAARNIICNCLNCQKSSGSAFLTNILYKKENYSITSGSSKVKIYHDSATDSKSKLERAFCSECGSNLYIRNVTNPKMAENIVVCGGSVEGNHETFAPQSELFTHRRHKWVPEVVKKKKKPAAESAKL